MDVCTTLQGRNAALHLPLQPVKYNGMHNQPAYIALYAGTHSNARPCTHLCHPLLWALWQHSQLCRCHPAAGEAREDIIYRFLQR